MRIPESTKYRPNEKRVEDILGYTLCTQCRNCAMTKPNQIVETGRWYCFAKKRWRRGYDVLMYQCPDFEMKHCSHCLNKNRCRVPYEHRWVAWCNKYREATYPIPSRYFYGRPLNAIKRLKDPIAIKLEEDFAASGKKLLEKKPDAVKKLLSPAWWENYSAYDPSDGSAPQGESEEDKAGAT